MANIVKTAARTGSLENIAGEMIPGPYQPDLEDMQQLFELAMSPGAGLWKALDIAFRFGFVMGNHATINRGIKKI